MVVVVVAVAVAFEWDCDDIIVDKYICKIVHEVSIFVACPLHTHKI